MNVATAIPGGQRAIEGVVRAVPGKLGDYLRFGYFDWYLRKVPEEILADQRAYWNRQGQVRWRKSGKYKYDQLVEFIRQNIRDDESLIDLGCGAGEALYHIHQAFPELELCGVDVADTMIERAERLLPAVRFIRDYYGPNLKLPRNYDIVMTRSALPCIQERDLQPILDWMATVSNRRILLSELIFEGNLTDAEGRPLEKVNEYAYRRPYDGTFVRDYTRYSIPGFKLKQVSRETGDSGNCSYLFERT